MKRREKIKLPNGKGQDLSALLELPLDMDPYAVAIFAHCFTCNKNFTAMRNVSRALQANDMAVLRFDFTGLGESEGEFSDTTFASNLDDLTVAADFMEERFPGIPRILVGHSLGGAAVLHAAQKIDNVAALVTIGAPFEPYHVTHLFDDKLDELESTGKAEINIGGRPITIGKKFLDDIKERSPVDIIKELKKPILILHSPQDHIVEIKNAAKIYQAAFHPKSFVSLNGADHMLSDTTDSLYAGEVISSWVRRYLPRPVEDTINTTAKVAARLEDEDGFTTHIKIGKHRILADEPRSVGGLDLGPDPYGLLTASLAACTTMTLRIYAQRKKWDLQEVTVHIDHEKKHKEDCDDCEDAKSRIDHFYKKIELKGDLDDKQKDRLLEIADKCPVHKTLHLSAVIKTELYIGVD